MDRVERGVQALESDEVSSAGKTTGRFGPNTAEVERAIALGHVAGGWSPVVHD
jgi:hypothetical protein